MKERILGVTFNVPPIVCVRVIDATDSKEVKDEKRKYPFKLHNEVIVTVVTNLRSFSFIIPKGYIWNGADIPRFFWRLIGSSTDNTFLLASMVHDFILDNKPYVYQQVLGASISLKEYRRFTTLIFREIIKNSGVNTIKANIMSWSVDVFQQTICKRSWKCQ